MFNFKVTDFLSISLPGNFHSSVSLDIVLSQSRFKKIPKLVD